MKYPIFSLLGIVLLGSGCFNPRIKEGGFACTGPGSDQCPKGWYCVYGVCSDNPNYRPPQGVGGNGAPDMTMAAGDMSMMPSSDNGDMSMPNGNIPDMTQSTTPPDLVRPPLPDMSKPANNCAHSPCTAGGALKSSCDPCVTAVCNQDPLCCSSLNGWDSVCVQEVQQYCTPPLPAGC